MRTRADREPVWNLKQQVPLVIEKLKHKDFTIPGNRTSLELKRCVLLLKTVWLVFHQLLIEPTRISWRDPLLIEQFGTQTHFVTFQCPNQNETARNTHCYIIHKTIGIETTIVAVNSAHF